jgi:hypothetical protein
MRFHSSSRNNAHDQPSILIHRCPPRCWSTVSGTYLWFVPRWLLQMLNRGMIYKRIHTTFSQAYLTNECMSIGNVTVCALLLSTWSWVRSSAPEDCCCNPWIVANVDTITALATVALSLPLSLPLALALMRSLQSLSYSHHT